MKYQAVELEWEYGQYSSIDYKEEVIQFINILKNNINEKHIG